MKIKDIFETRVEEKIEPVIKVGERQDEKKLASEIGGYVVTPTIERYLDDFLEHYTDSLLKRTTEVGVWISGYFGSGKSHLAKIAALLIENRNLDGIAAGKRFEARIPPQAPRRDSIIRSLGRLNQCDSQVLAFNLNTLADSKTTPLPRLLQSQYYLSKGYSGNVLYARVIEAELDKRGKLAELHAAAERLAKKPWVDMQSNLGFYSKALYQAACETAPEVFSSPEQVAAALKTVQDGELFNVQFLVRTLLDDLEARQRELKRPCRLALVLDESGQWIEDDAGRLAQLQALVEEAAEKGQGKIWVFVTTHEDMGSIYENARALRGDMKKIEGRFRLKWNLTTENIELVLEDRIFKKKLSGKGAVSRAYNDNPGVLRDLGELKNTSQILPECTEERFVTFYPFFPYQIHLIPEIVKSLRSAGGRGEQLSGSTRTLLAITQDILKSGRRRYLDASVGELVSFDEVYGNLAGEGEVTPDVRRELSRIESVVADSTTLTRRVAEVLFLIREIAYIPRTIDNIARLLAESTVDDVTSIVNRIKPELDKLIRAKLVARIGEEYEFLTGERRTFEDELADEAAGIKWQDLQSGLSKFATSDVIGFSTIVFKGTEFPARIFLDETKVAKDGFVEIRVLSPLSVSAGTKLPDIEDTSLRPDEQQTVFVVCDRVHEFEADLKRFLAMKAVIDRWKGDPHRSDEAHKLASERESIDLDKLRRRVIDGIKDGQRHAHVVFRGGSRNVSPKSTQTPSEALRAELANYWPTLYPKYEKVPVRIINEQRAILDVMKGTKELSADVRELKLLDKSGQADLQCPLLDSIRIYLSTRQSRKERTLGRNLIDEFIAPPYGWDPGAIRVGVAALVRSGAVRVLVNKRPFTNPADSELQDALRVSRNFDKVELILEEAEIDHDVLTEVRSLLIRLTGVRKIDETPAALSSAMEAFSKEVVDSGARTALWSEPADLPLPSDFFDGKEVFENILALSNPMHRVSEIHAQREHLEQYVAVIQAQSTFVEKWGKVFTEMRDFAAQVGAVEYRLPASGACASFIGNWRVARANASAADEQVWRDLQSGRAAALLELEGVLSAWRDDARNLVQAAIERLPQDLTGADLSGEELRESLVAPLRDFVYSIDGQADVAGVAALPDRARHLIAELRTAFQAEQRKHSVISSSDTSGISMKPVTHVRIVDVATTTRIQTEAQWETIRDRLDEAVRKELANGNDVDLG